MGAVVEVFVTELADGGIEGSSAGTAVGTDRKAHSGASVSACGPGAKTLRPAVRAASVSSAS